MNVSCEGINQPNQKKHSKQQKMNALHYACRGGFQEIVRLLLKYFPNASVTDKFLVKLHLQQSLCSLYSIKFSFWFSKTDDPTSSRYKKRSPWHCPTSSWSKDIPLRQRRQLGKNKTKKLDLLISAFETTMQHTAFDYACRNGDFDLVSYFVEKYNFQLEGVRKNCHDNSWSKIWNVLLSN